jgi:hypothetical protein
MVKFGERLPTMMVPGWETHYINYTIIKDQQVQAVIETPGSETSGIRTREPETTDRL